MVRRGVRAAGQRESTLAPALAGSLNLPLLAKDTIKDVLMSRLPVPDVGASRQLGRAAVAVLLAVAAESPRGAVLESNFFRSRARTELAALPGRVVEVFCRCDREVAAARFAARAGTRAAGHFDCERHPDELWNDEIAEPVAGPWPVIEADTNGRLDLEAVLAAVRAAMIGSPT